MGIVIFDCLKIRGKVVRKKNKRKIASIGLLIPFSRILERKRRDKPRMAINLLK